jgi:hypothetical protein
MSDEKFNTIKMGDDKVRRRAPEFNEDRYISKDALGMNLREIANFRTMISIVGGIASGLFGVDGLWGFLLFGVYAILGSCVLYLRFGTGWNQYFKNRKWLLLGWQSGFLGYLLFWIMVHNIVYILS